MQCALETEAKGKAEALRMKKKLEADAADLLLAMLRHKTQLRSISCKSEMPRSRLMKNLQLNLLLLMLRLQLIARLLLCRMHLKRAVLCWRLLIVRDVQPSKNLPTPMRHLPT